MNKRLTHEKGWMATLPEKTEFQYEFDYGCQFTNISYNSMFYFLEPNDYVSIALQLNTMAGW